jgi:hypothetical protein
MRRLLPRTLLGEQQITDSSSIGFVQGATKLWRLRTPITLVALDLRSDSLARRAQGFRYVVGKVREAMRMDFECRTVKPAGIATYLAKLPPSPPSLPPSILSFCFFIGSLRFSLGLIRMGSCNSGTGGPDRRY